MTEFIITCQSELQKDGSYKIERYRELVRCKNCRNGGIDSTSYPQFWCSAHSEYHKPDWYCADGERKDSEKERIAKGGRKA